MPQTLRPGIPSAFRGNSDLRSAQCASHRADYFCGFSQLTTLKTRSAPPSHHARQRVAFLRQLYTLSALRGFSGLAWWTTTVLRERQLLSSSSYPVDGGNQRPKMDPGGAQPPGDYDRSRALQGSQRAECSTPASQLRTSTPASQLRAGWGPGLAGDPWRAGAKALGGYI